MPRLFLAVSILSMAYSAAAWPQTMYNGWDLGPDYGAMVDGMLRQQQEVGRQMQAREAQIIQQTMQDPRAQALYRQHLAEGGQLSFPHFAYQYAATAGFTSDGIARFRRGEADNQRREQESRSGLRQAERDRAAAQQGQRDAFSRNQNEAGLGLQGRGTYVDPTNGERRELPYTQPGAVTQDPLTGQAFVMDGSGTAYARAPNGQWYPLQPAR